MRLYRGASVQLEPMREDGVGDWTASLAVEWDRNCNREFGGLDVDVTTKLGMDALKVLKKGLGKHLG
jgi:hypothetical protein